MSLDWQVQVERVAAEQGWAKTSRATFKRGTDVIEVSPDGQVFRVVTELDHRKWGRRRMQRHKVRWDFLVEIFKNPRVHTNPHYHPGRNDQWSQ